MTRPMIASRKLALALAATLGVFAAVPAAHADRHGYKHGRWADDRSYPAAYAPAYGLLAQSSNRHGRYDEARAASEPVLAAGAADAALLVHAALIRLAAGDAAAGRALLARAAAANPRYEAFHAHR